MGQFCLSIAAETSKREDLLSPVFALGRTTQLTDCISKENTELDWIHASSKTCRISHISESEFESNSGNEVGDELIELLELELLLVLTR